MIRPTAESGVSAQRSLIGGKILGAILKPDNKIEDLRLVIRRCGVKLPLRGLAQGLAGASLQ